MNNKCYETIESNYVLNRRCNFQNMWLNEILVNNFITETLQCITFKTH